PDLAGHAERARGDAGQQADDVVERPDLRLKQQGPEIAYYGGGKHHRQQDDGRPETVRAELTVDEQRKPEADHDLHGDRTDDETSSHLQAVPNVLVGQDIDIVVEADEADRQVRHAEIETGEGEPDHPDQRKDVDREQQGD